MKTTKLLSTILLIALTATSVSAQILSPATQKLSPATRLLIAQQKNALFAPTRAAVNTESVLTAILLEKGSNVTDDTLSAYGVRVEKRRGRLILAYVPVSRLESLTAIEGIRSIDTGREAEPYNDIAREVTSVTSVHAKDVEQSAPEVSGALAKYRGKGVYVGIIDYEIDYGHPAFRDAQGKSRIKKAVTIGRIAGNINREDGDENNIEDIVVDRMYEYVSTGHGTHVAGIAAGSTALLPEGDPMKKYYGMAPEADIIVFDVENLSDNDILMCITEAFDKADEDKCPVVLNLSKGIKGTLLDGSDIFNEKMSALLETYDPAGKIVCVAAGNSAGMTITAQMECDKPIVNGEWTLQKKLAYPLEKLWPNLAEFCSADDKEFAVQYEYRYIPKSGGEHPTLITSPLFTSDNFQDQVGTFGAWRGFGQTAEGDSIGVYVIPDFHVASNNRKMHMASISTNGDSVYVVVNFYTKEEGVSIDALSNNLPFLTMESDEYVIPNDYGSLNVFTCLDNVISVGSYNTRTSFTDINGKEYTDRTVGEDGQVSLFSSYCTPHYGKPRPDVVAPGSYIVSASHHNLEESILMGTTNYDGMNFQWSAMTGTSMASPAAAGIIALWLQANPALTVDDVREIIAKTSDFDEACAANPYQAGHGKINALRGLEYILSSSGINDVSIDNHTGTAKFIDKDHRLRIRCGNQMYDAIGRKIY